MFCKERSSIFKSFFVGSNLLYLQSGYVSTGICCCLVSNLINFMLLFSIKFDQFLGCAVILAAALPLIPVIVVLLVFSCFTRGLLTQKLDIQGIGRYLIFVNSFATQKGVAKFKSAATYFFYNSGTVVSRSLKFRTQIGYFNLLVFLQLRRVGHSSKVLPPPFSVTLDVLPHSFSVEFLKFRIQIFNQNSVLVL